MIPCINLILKSINKYKLNILILASAVCFGLGAYELNQELNTIKQELNAHQTLINGLRRWNHHLDKKIIKIHRALQNEAIID